MRRLVTRGARFDTVKGSRWDSKKCVHVRVGVHGRTVKKVLVLLSKNGQAVSCVMWDTW